MPSTDIAYSRTGKITNTSGHAVWTQPCGQINSTLKGPASDYLNKEITIWRKVENKRGTYYQFSETKTPNIKAWLDARAITLYDQVHFNEEYNQMAVISTVIGHAVWSTPYLQSDSKLIAPASNYEGKRVEIIRRAKTTRSIYYQFSYDNKVIGWLDTRAFSLIPSNTAMVISNSTNDIFSNITDAYNKNNPINNSQNYSQQFVNIDESNSDDNLGNYVKISQDNKPIGWIDSENVIDEKTMDSIENDEESIIPEELIDKVNDYVTIENNEFVLSNKAEDVLTSEEFVEVEGQIDQTNAEIEADETLSETHIEGNIIVQEIYEDEPNQLLKASKKAYIKAKYTWWGMQIQFSHKAVVDFNDFYWGAGTIGGLGANKRMGKFLAKKGIKIASRYAVCLSLFGGGLAWGMGKKDKGKGVNLNCVLYVPATITTAK
ncbi:GW domain-containing glycosaminoglycan-binding protein [Listeria monocytogenes]|nr:MULTISPECIES: GW domain-containing glycosaminoglycan-binding protein [Listeria]EAC6520460.1 GW domain-containing glycosaminoglycan-binding protein [Listeria monocytogenes serotype 4b]EAE3726276.1 GW domain-containing glycosaminoglycan-binding protein [Listeria monocytogenes serotype 1/2b]EAG6253886.1 GW domain-containing glycosaminoglycan-binding protein [Listeria monocytogenes CFSAN003806]EAG6262805.1 GW domain-containing glycosaminoglycan-binding protein [Listeria monocytogenes CFSAN003725